MPKIFKSGWFYIPFIISLIFFGYIFSPKASSSWFGIWTSKENMKLGSEYIRGNLVDDTVLGTVLANVSLGESDSKKYFYISKSVDLITSANNLINTDVVELLDSSLNKTAVYESHVKEIEFVLANIEDVSSFLYQKIDEHKSQSQACETEKQRYDKMFFQGVTQDEKDLIFEGLNGSISNGPCYIQDRVMSNAYVVIYDKLIFYKGLLNKKLSLLQSNQDMIIQNFQMFQNTYLDDLVNIRNEVNNLKVESN